MRQMFPGRKEKRLSSQKKRSQCPAGRKKEAKLEAALGRTGQPQHPRADRRGTGCRHRESEITGERGWGSHADRERILNREGSSEQELTRPCRNPRAGTSRRAPQQCQGP